jgi:hypothetical protein
VGWIELYQILVVDDSADFASLGHIAGKYVGLGLDEFR